MCGSRLKTLPVAPFAETVVTSASSPSRSYDIPAKETARRARLVHDGRTVIGKLLCLLGFHRWDTVVNDGERYLVCRRCGVSGEPPEPWRYPDRGQGP